MRCDLVLASKALAQCATSYEVIRMQLTDMASDPSSSRWSTHRDTDINKRRDVSLLADSSG
jgi:hypothetical protein